MLTWSRYSTSFGEGAVVCRGGKIVRMYLPERGSAKIETVVARDFPDATEASRRSQGPGSKAAKAIEALFRSGESVDSLAADLEWPAGTPFQLAVLRACLAIPHGEVRTYAELAEAAGYPGRARAAGTVMARNPLAPVIPCHRIVPSSGGVGNYGGGSDMKVRLLELEGAPVR
ncbi:MGMT family protein [Candidatus Poribacteria bacterium]|nr:MGMT family protein [Candidatus Poribacteria bacterium]